MIFRLLLLTTLLLASVVPSDAREELRGELWSLTLDVPDMRGPVPAVMMLPGCSGNQPQAVRQGIAAHRRALLRRGFAVAELDVLSRRGQRTICADAAALARLERAAAANAAEAAQRLASDPRIDSRRIAFLGQSFGGSVALRLASASGKLKPFAAVVAYYPWCADGYGVVLGRSDFAIPVLILTGSDDAWNPVSRCRALKPAAKSIPAVIRTYPGAVHSFDLGSLARQRINGVTGPQLVGGDPAAARASRAAFLDFLDRALR